MRHELRDIARKGGESHRFVGVRDDLLKSRFHGADQVIGCAGPGRQSHGIPVSQPVLMEVGDCLDVEYPVAVPAAGGHQFTGIVAVGAPENQDDVTPPGESLGSGLPLFGGLTDRVPEGHLASGESFPQGGDQTANPIHRLCGRAV